MQLHFKKLQIPALVEFFKRLFKSGLISTHIG